MTLMLDSVKEIDIEKDGINIQLLLIKIFFSVHLVINYVKSWPFLDGA